MKQKIKLESGYEVFFQTPDDGYSYFFGYYDKSPLNLNNSKLLSHRVSFDSRDVKDGDIAEVGYFDLKTKLFIRIDDTLAWNWQQGSQLQWLSPEFDKEIIYNKVIDNSFVSVIYNLETKKKRVIPFPIYVVHPNGKEALGINYERHYWCRPGYNYQNIKNTKWDKPYHKDDGIYKIDLINGKFDQLIKITDIIDNEKLPEFEKCNNWLEHMMYNPSGNRFMFFHRWHKEKDHTRLYTVNSDNGSDLFLFPDNDKFYSHADWKNDAELTIWTKEFKNKTAVNSVKRTVNTINKIKVLLNIVRPFYRALKFYLPQKMVNEISSQSKLLNYKDKTNEYEIVGDGFLYGNGHITWSNDKKYLLNDTYADKKGYRQLMLYSIEKRKIINIGKFFSVYNSCGYRADLHPRFSADNKMIIIDSAHINKRKIILIANNY